QFKLPVVSSITCYTAHFDNAESFGEVFVKIANKGAIGFWGSVGLTYWQTGRTMNQHLYDHLFNNRNYVIGSAILSAKATVGGGTYDVMTAQLAYLGDPAIEIAFPKTPDFAIKSSDITISPQNPLKDDTVTVSVSIRNWGVTFPDDSVTLEVFKNTTDSVNLIQEIKIPSFPYTTTANVEWIPLEAGLYNLIARINEKDAIEESDHSDNINSNSFSVFDFGQPNIIKPVNGYFTNEDKVDFVFSDIGFYFDRNFDYIIEINTVPDFNSGSITLKSPVIQPVDGVVRWNSNSLSNGEYFWRAVIFDVVDTNFSPVQSFSINNSGGSGYMAQNKQLQLFERRNIDYIDELKSLILNTEVQPPHPEEKHLLDSIMISLPPDSTHPSTFTTDGTYLYFGHLPAWTADSKIYKIGTGYNGTVAGENYGAIPNLDIYIYSHLMSHEGFLYTCTGSLDQLLRIDPESGDTSTIIISDSLLHTLNTPTQIGGVYLYSDGTFIYNLATGTSSYPNKFVLRKFDPSNNWIKIGEDIVFNGTILPRVSSFFVAEGYLILYENYIARALRRYRLSDGLFEEEWRYSSEQLKYFGIAYDRLNDLVYFSRFIPGINVSYSPGFFKYKGTFIESQGQLTSQEIGPASKWHNLEFEIDNTNSQGTYKSYLFGKNPNSSEWDLLDSLNQSTYNLEGIHVSDYNFIKLQYNFTDSSSGGSEPLKFNSLKVNYEYLPEISMIPKDLTFAPDSMLQGIDVNMNLKVHNLGYIPVDSLKLDFYLNEGDSIYLTKYISVQPDSFTVIDQVIETSKIIFDTNIKTVATSPIQEYYSYNNLIENNFFVARDSVKPIFSISFDGKEIIDGDIISSEPTIIITLEDNSPLPSTPSHFTLVHQNVPLNIETNPDIAFTYSHGEPLSKTEIVWTPVLDDGVHTLEILAKDSSGNFFDSTSHKSVFQVYSDADIRNVYNYPNPFADDTYFTFELRGTIVPEELRIKIYTIAGRLIRELTIPPNQMQIGFNRHYWNGRDNEGDEIANGLYFYKVIANQEGETRTVTQKLAKVK
ncbi:MAG: C25 family cysteine peptidase, partial [Ignavibacteriaceae bacterium]